MLQVRPFHPSPSWKMETFRYTPRRCLSIINVINFGSALPGYPTSVLRKTKRFNLAPWEHVLTRMREGKPGMYVAWLVVGHDKAATLPPDLYVPWAAAFCTYEEPDEIQLVSFYIGQRRFGDAERMMSVLLERQGEKLKNGGADDVAMGFTLRALAGYEEARGRLPFARALRENSLDVFASALGPTHGQVSKSA